MKKVPLALVTLMALAATPAVATAVRDRSEVLAAASTLHASNGEKAGSASGAKFARDPVDDGGTLGRLLSVLLCAVGAGVAIAGAAGLPTGERDTPRARRGMDLMTYGFSLQLVAILWFGALILT